MRFNYRAGISASNPYVPLSYSSVEQRTFFKRPENEDIDAILAVLDNDAETFRWPFQINDPNIWIPAQQPHTHVQVQIYSGSDAKHRVETFPATIRWRILKSRCNAIFTGQVSRCWDGFEHVAPRTATMVLCHERTGLRSYNRCRRYRTLPSAASRNYNATETRSKHFFATSIDEH